MCSTHILAHSCTFTMMRIRGTFDVHWTKFHSRILTMKKVHITYSHVKTQTIALFLLTCTFDFWTMYCCVDIMVYKNQFWLRGMAISFYVMLTWNFASWGLYMIDYWNEIKSKRNENIQKYISSWLILISFVFFWYLLHVFNHSD